MISNTCLPVCIFLLAGYFVIRWLSESIISSKRQIQLLPILMGIAVLVTIVQNKIFGGLLLNRAVEWEWLNLDSIRLSLGFTYYSYPFLSIYLFIAFFVSVFIGLNRSLKYEDRVVPYFIGVTVIGSLIVSTSAEYFLIFSWIGLMILPYILIRTENTENDENELIDNTAIYQILFSCVFFVLLLVGNNIFGWHFFQGSKALHEMYFNVENVGKISVRNTLILLAFGPMIGLFPYKGLFSETGRKTWFYLIHVFLVLPLGLHLVQKLLINLSVGEVQWEIIAFGGVTVLVQLFVLFGKKDPQEVLHNLVTISVVFSIFGYSGSEEFAAFMSMNFNEFHMDKFIVFYAGFLMVVSAVIIMNMVSGESVWEKSQRSMKINKINFKRKVSGVLLTAGIVVLVKPVIDICVRNVQLFSGWRFQYYRTNLHRLSLDMILFFIMILSFSKYYYIFKKSDFVRESTWGRMTSMGFGVSSGLAMVTAVMALICSNVIQKHRVMLKAQHEINYFHILWGIMILVLIIVVAQFLVRFSVNEYLVARIESKNFFIDKAVGWIIGMPVFWTGRLVWYLDGWVEMLFTDVTSWCINQWSEISLVFDRWFFSMVGEGFFKKLLEGGQAFSGKISDIKNQKIILFFIIMGLMILFAMTVSIF